VNREAARLVTSDMRLRAFALAAVPAAAVIAFASGCGSSSSGGGYGAAAGPTSAPAASSAVSAAAGGASAGGSSSGAPASAVTLRIDNFMFGAVTVPAGSTVDVVNSDGVPHTVNVNGTGIDVNISANGKATFAAPAKAGTYTLTCDIHPSMHGSLVVS
jgi:plastocyanin